MSQKTPIVALIRRVLNLYRVRVSVHGIENAFYNHPDYPSLKSISDVFDQWGVKHVVAHFSLENLVTLNAPFIAPLKTNEYVWVDQINDTKLKYWSEINGKKVVSHKDFNKVWSGIALIIEDVEDSGEQNYRVQHRQEKSETILKYIIIVSFLSIWGDAFY